MKLKSILALITILIINVNFTSKIADTSSLIVWSKISHNFGDIKQGQVMETEFTFQNLSKDTFILENVQGSCGCLASSWPKQPILTNEKGSIIVKFDSQGKSGNHLKSFSVFTNLGAYYLEIKANIIKN